MNLFKKKKAAWTVDTEEVLKKAKEQKRILELIDKWNAAAAQLEVPEGYYYIQDCAPHEYRLVRVFYWVRTYTESRRVVASGGSLFDSEVPELESCEPTVRVEHRSVGSPKGYRTRQEAIEALDRIVDPDKYRTKYHITPPLREMK